MTNNIESQIRNNFFKTKEDLYKYLLELKINQQNQFLTETEITMLLNLYDELYSKSEIPLDINNYSNKVINDKNFIVSEKDDRILVTTGNSNDFIQEFKEQQNDILAHTQDGMVNSNIVFNKMADTMKEEITLIPLTEAINSTLINQEILYKIKFFVTKMKINPYAYRINIQNGIFYNNETNEMYEVRKNENTNNYEIYVSGEIRYGNTTNVEQETETIENDHNGEQLYEETKNNHKVRRLIPTKNLNNAAFTNVGFLVINIISLLIVSASVAIIFLNK